MDVSLPSRTISFITSVGMDTFMIVRMMHLHMLGRGEDPRKRFSVIREEDSQFECAGCVVKSAAHSARGPIQAAPGSYGGRSRGEEQ